LKIELCLYSGIEIIEFNVEGLDENRLDLK
jgi:hypothetical protein